jgi:hypothetical protein
MATTKFVEKPRVIYFRFPLTHASEVKKIHEKLYLNWLSCFFEVILVERDCHYLEICDTFIPDLCIFESGKSLLHRRIKIEGVKQEKIVPKIGFIRSDAFCGSRPIFLSDMEAWGVETFFAINDVMLTQYLPDIADVTYAVPHFVDTNVFCDHNESKTIPIISSGTVGASRIWRNKVKKIVENEFAVLYLPHSGHVKNRSSSRMIMGEEYARFLNRALFSLADGGLQKTVVKKHLEIPASNCLLVTERTESVEAFGFKDMVNCIFADEKNIVDKIDSCLNSRETLDRISRNGYTLVQNNHAIRNRSQVLEWFNLYKTRKPGEKIVQTGLFEPLTLVPESSDLENFRFQSLGLDRQLLKQGDNLMEQLKYGEAIACYKRCIDYIQYMPEPYVRMTIAFLNLGQSNQALSLIQYPRSWRARVLGTPAPDPVEQAYMGITLLCEGKLSEAYRELTYYTELKHIELTRTQEFLAVASGQMTLSNLSDEVHYGRSVHVLPQQTTASWFTSLHRMLNACGQIKLAALAQDCSLSLGGGGNQLNQKETIVF